MIPFLLYHPKTRTTGRALAKLMGIRSGTRCAGRKNEIISHIIRWGNIREVSKTYRPERGLGYEPDGFCPRIEINERKAVALAGNKFKSLQVLQANGVSVPKFFRGAEIEGGIGLKGWIIFGRSFRHSWGRDITIFDNIEITGCDYYTMYIKPHKEWRVHVMEQKVILAQKKYFRKELFEKIFSTEIYPTKPGDWGAGTYGEDERYEEFEQESQFIRNNEHGWGFHDMNDIKNVPQNVLLEAVNAIKVLGLKFGAVDVISAEKGEDGKRKAYVLEVNTAPGLRDRNLEIYADYLSQILKPT